VIRNVQPGPAQAAAAPLQLERDLVRPGDVVRFSCKRGRTTKVYYVRATTAGYLAQFSSTSTLWCCFAGRRVRCYDHAVAIGPETDYGVAAGKLVTVSRAPLALRRVSLAGLREARPPHTAS
jgi:hypothetical protein